MTKHHLVRLAPILSYCLLIFWESAQAHAPVPDLGFQWQDKVYHLAGYTVFGLLLQWALYGWSITPKRVAVLCIVLTSLYGISDELHQYFVPGRSCEWGDWVADTLGAVVSLGITSFIPQLRSRKTEH